jgi:hypothetical protein
MPNYLNIALLLPSALSVITGAIYQLYIGSRRSVASVQGNIAPETVSRNIPPALIVANNTKHRRGLSIKYLRPTLQLSR